MAWRSAGLSGAHWEKFFMDSYAAAARHIHGVRDVEFTPNFGTENAPPPDGIAWAVIGQAYASLGSQMWAPEHFLVLVGADGALLWWSVITDDRWHEAATTGLWHLGPFLLASTFLHARNVTIREVAVAEKIQQKRTRSGRPPLFSFGVLDVGPVTRVLRDAQKRGPATLPVAMHICRGHFKDYRDGRGLFGRHKGLFWWDMQVRGSAEVGLHDKQYRVHA